MGVLQCCVIPQTDFVFFFLLPWMGCASYLYALAWMPCFTVNGVFFGWSNVEQNREAERNLQK